MRRILLFLLAECLLLTLAACSSSEISTAENSNLIMDAYTEDTTATAETTDTKAPTSIIETQSTHPTEETTYPTEETTHPTEEDTHPTEETDSERFVKICRADFPIYNGPGYDYYPVSTVQVATVYTVVDAVLDSEGNLWGKLKSGAGWVDLSLNEKETHNMPPVTVSQADQKLLDSGNYYYCNADSSAYAYEIAFSAHDFLSDVSFFSIDTINEYKRGAELFHLSKWDPRKPLVASVCFPGHSSMYGLEFTDSHGITRIYSVWESGRNGSIEVSPFDAPLAPADPEPDVSLEPPSIPHSLNMLFASGAGAWGTTLTMDENGYFSGAYLDSDMGDADEDYPNGTCYICDFSGVFQITGTDTYAVALSLVSLDIKDYGTDEWIEDDILYIASDACGIAGGSSFLLYMPSTPVSELPEDIYTWWYDIPETGTLGCYALYCIETGCTFFSN